jgi:hypothetical protein
MIVVVGSRHDSVATDLVASWEGAALCSAEDFVSPGWVWPQSQRVSRTWIVNTNQVRDDDVTGVFIRRPTVYPEELATTHPADRVFLASEIHSFLTFVLATTSARVVNPVCDGAFGEDALRLERWSTVASELGISVRPLRVSSESRRRTRYRTYSVEVVGAEVFGEAPPRVLEGADQFLSALGLAWGTLLFAARHCFSRVTGGRRPSGAATAALGRLLKAGRS